MAVLCSPPERICCRRAFVRVPDSGALQLVNGRARNRDVLAGSYNRLAALQGLYKLGSVLSEPVPIATVKRIEDQTPSHITRIRVDGQHLFILGARFLKAVQIEQRARATAQGRKAARIDRQTSVIAAQGGARSTESR